MMNPWSACQNVSDREVSQFRQDARRGLRTSPKNLPSKYFYDDRGCELFEAICELEEYYPTRTELSIMKRHATCMARVIGTPCAVVELGCGSALKTEILLEKLGPVTAYVPVDVAPEYLRVTVERFQQRQPDLKVLPLQADFTEPFQLPDSVAQERTVVYFPGSTIGNFAPDAAVKLLENVARVSAPHGGLLIGVDRKKDVSVLEAAYNDSLGVTAAFNVNLLERMNRELEADFDLDRFEHRAVYNEQAGRIEMHLVSLVEQTACVANEEFQFDRHETICTEYSHKYEIDEFGQLAQQAGWQLHSQWSDDNDYFSVLYLTLGRRTS